MTHDEMIAIIQAHKAGKKIQYAEKGTEVWIPCVNEPAWNFYCRDYRVDPVEDKRERVRHAVSEAVHLVTPYSTKWEGWPGTTRIEIAVLEALEEEGVL